MTINRLRPARTAITDRNGNAVVPYMNNFSPGHKIVICFMAGKPAYFKQIISSRQSVNILATKAGN